MWKYYEWKDGFWLFRRFDDLEFSTFWWHRVFYVLMGSRFSTFWWVLAFRRFDDISSFLRFEGLWNFRRFDEIPFFYEMRTLVIFYVLMIFVFSMKWWDGIFDDMMFPRFKESSKRRKCLSSKWWDLRFFRRFDDIRFSSFWWDTKFSANWWLYAFLRNDGFQDFRRFEGIEFSSYWRVWYLKWIFVVL